MKLLFVAFIFLVSCKKETDCGTITGMYEQYSQSLISGKVITSKVKYHVIILSVDKKRQMDKTVTHEKYKECFSQFYQGYSEYVCL